MAEHTTPDIAPVADTEVQTQDFKSIFRSKTFWVNTIALVAFIVQQKWGFVVDETIQVQILTVINVGLRMITHERVVWK